MPKRLLLVILTALTVAMTVTSFAVSASPAGAQYCPGTDPRCPSVTGNGPGFGVGDTVELTGHGFQPGSKVDFTIDNCGSTVLLGTVIADANYEVHFSFPTPASCCPGVHTVTLTGTGADGKLLVLTYQITVTGNGCPPSATVVGSLPRTGSDSGTPVALGVGLVVAGGALVLLARRRTAARRQNIAPGA